ncbi:MAG: hypothetical protein DRH10_00610 [Deltaproteobacteria bacterium]|nr:MAG: hypothetical protein DRH10_00610 [Deltaproteobacteria bacterium]
MAKKSRYNHDWQAIEAEYRTNQFSDAELARRHGCSRGAIQKRVKKFGWTRDLSRAVAQASKAKLIAEDAKLVAGEVAGSNVRERNRETIEQAAERRVAVVRLHRNDIQILRELEAKLLKELLGEPTKLYITQYKGKIVSKELSLTAAERSQAANNLANVQHKRIQLERQSFNLNDKGDDDDGLPTVETHDPGRELEESE